MKDIHSIVRLLKNYIYPTYQLHATMSNKKISPEAGLVLGALTVCSWLRERLGEGIPSELSLPEADSFRELSMEQLKSFHINRGFVVDVVSLPEKGLWTLQIVEPDLGSDPGNPNQARRPVAGRIIETNVGFCIKNRQLQVGIKTVISDPENTVKAMVYRPAFVKKLYNNPDFGLLQCAHIQPKLIYIDTLESLKRLHALYDDGRNQMPCLIFTKQKKFVPDEKLPLKSLSMGALSTKMEDGLKIGNQQVKPIKAEITVSKMEAEKQKGKSKKGQRVVVSSFSELRVLANDPVLAESKPLLNLVKQVRSGKEKYVLPEYNIFKMAGQFAGFAYVYLVNENLFEKLATELDINIVEGDAVLLEPKCFGGAKKIYAYGQNDVSKQIMRDIFCYPREKDYSFGDIYFLSGARDALIQGKAELEALSESQLEQWQIEMLAVQKKYESKLNDERGNYAKLEAKIISLKQQITLEENKNKDLRESEEKLKDRHRQELAQKDAYIKFLERHTARPHTKKELADWITRVHGKHLFLHPRALQTLDAANLNSDRLELLYDALDYMATDFWENRYGDLDDEELLNLSSQKYHRAFEITPCKSTSINVYPEQYRIPYFKDEQGKVKPSDLNYHLKAGNKAEHLVRIYFLFDNVKKLIVVGSMPEHLQTVTFG